MRPAEPAEPEEQGTGIRLRLYEVGPDGGKCVCCGELIPALRANGQPGMALKVAPQVPVMVCLACAVRYGGMVEVDQLGFIRRYQPRAAPRTAWRTRVREWLAAVRRKI